MTKLKRFSLDIKKTQKVVSLFGSMDTVKSSGLVDCPVLTRIGVELKKKALDFRSENTFLGAKRSQPSVSPKKKGDKKEEVKKKEEKEKEEEKIGKNEEEKKEEEKPVEKLDEGKEQPKEDVKKTDTKDKRKGTKKMSKK